MRQAFRHAAPTLFLGAASLGKFDADRCRRASVGGGTGGSAGGPASSKRVGDASGDASGGSAWKRFGVERSSIGSVG